MNNEMLFNIMLYIHIAGGMTSLILGFYIMIQTKGTKIHKNVGLVYHYSMLASAILSIPMSMVHPNLFLLIVGVWTMYMLLTGKRYLGFKSIADVQKIDYAISIGMGIFGTCLAGYGAYLLYHGVSFGTVAIVFGLIAVNMVIIDFKNYNGKSKYKNFGLVTHIQRMVGSYVASVTAFLVVNNTVIPNVVAWLLPALIIVPFIVYWSKKWGKVVH